MLRRTPARTGPGPRAQKQSTNRLTRPRTSRSAGCRMGHSRQRQSGGGIREEASAQLRGRKRTSGACPCHATQAAARARGRKGRGPRPAARGPRAPSRRSWSHGRSLAHQPITPYSSYGWLVRLTPIDGRGGGEGTARRAYLSARKHTASLGRQRGGGDRFFFVSHGCVRVAQRGAASACTYR